MTETRAREHEPRQRGGTYQEVRRAHCENVLHRCQQDRRANEFWKTDQKRSRPQYLSGHPHTTERHARSCTT